MTRIVALLFSAALLPALARLTHALLSPTLRALALDPTMLFAVLVCSAEVLAGTTPTYAAMGPYTAAEQQDIAESLAALIAAVPSAFGLVIAPADLSRLVAAVAARLTPAGA